MKIENNIIIIETDIFNKEDERKIYLESLKKYQENKIADIFIADGDWLYFKVPEFDNVKIILKVNKEEYMLLCKIARDINKEKYQVDYELFEDKIIIKIKEK